MPVTAIKRCLINTIMKGTGMMARMIRGISIMNICNKPANIKNISSMQTTVGVCQTNTSVGKINISWKMQKKGCG